jgi:MFS family permease
LDSVQIFVNDDWVTRELDLLYFSIAALVGSLSIGMTFFVSPLAGILIDSIGLRRTAVLGGAIATVGMLASSFALAHVSALKTN